MRVPQSGGSAPQGQALLRRVIMRMLCRAMRNIRAALGRGDAMEPMLRNTGGLWWSDEPEDTPVAVWRLRRNCALTPRQLGVTIVALGAAAVVIAALTTALVRTWLFVVFALVEGVALLIAYLRYSRHALDGETITLFRHALVLEIDDGERHVQWRVSPSMVRIVCEGGNQARALYICYRQQRIEIGRHVTPALRVQIGEQLKREIAACR
jgi:uncharacterized membrane protein